MKVSYEERNGRRYAYKCTSVIIPGKKNPVSRKEYLGVVDPDTGEVIPKRRYGKGGDVTEGSPSKDYGNVLIVIEVFRRSGVIEDLKAIFGRDHLKILALAVAYAIHPSGVYEARDVFASSSICECLGEKVISSDDSEIRRVVNRIDRSSSIEFFRMRGRRMIGNPTVYVRSIEIGSLKRLFPISNPSSLGMQGPGIVVALDGGIPLGFRILKSFDHLLREPQEVIGDLKSMDGIPFLVIDRRIAPQIDISELVVKGVQFVTAYDFNSPQYPMLRASFSDCADCSEITDTEVVLVGKSGVVLRNTAEGYRLEHRRNGEKDVSRSLEAYLVRNPGDYGEMEILIRSLKDIRDLIDGGTYDDPEKVILAEAGSGSRFLGYKSDSNGKTHVWIKRSEFEAFKGESRLSILLSTSGSYDDIRKIKADVDLFKAATESLEGNILYPKAVTRGATMVGQGFIRYLASIAHAEMCQILLPDGRSGEIRDLLYAASSYRCIFSDGGVVRGHRSRRVTLIFKLFGVKEPEDISGLSDGRGILEGMGGSEEGRRSLLFDPLQILPHD